MSIKNLSDGDFSFWLRYNDKDRSCHEREFMSEISPDLMRALYRGMRSTADEIKKVGSENSRDHLVTLNRIFTTTNTVLPNIYHQNPKKMAIPTYTSSDLGAGILTAALNYYTRKTGQKAENQEAIMNAWFFGLGWKKIGYAIATESSNEGPESKLSPVEAAAIKLRQAMGQKPDATQAKLVPDIIRYETLTNTSESPCNVLVDHKADLNTYKVITHRLPRTLFDLMNFGEYEPEVLKALEEKFRYQNGSRFDVREIDLVLNEKMIEQRNGIWILTFVDGFNQPLRYEQLTYEGSMPWSPLAITNEPGVRYPISHMKVASRVQTWIDNVANLQVDILGKMRNQHYVNEKLLSPGQKKAFKQNKIGGIVYGNRPATPGDIMNISSQGVGSDMFAMLAQFQQNATEIMGSTEQRTSGKSRNDTFGQDKLAEMGTQIRESGIVNAVRDWMVRQTRIEAQYLKQFSNDQLIFKITPQDFANPEFAAQTQEAWGRFRTPDQMMPLRHFIEGEFDYDVNVYDAVKPDNPNIRRELLEGMQVLAPLQSTFIQEGGRIRLLAMAEKYAKTFETIDMSQFIEKLDSMQQSALQASQALSANGGIVPPELGGGTVSTQEVPQEAASGA